VLDKIVIRGARTHNLKNIDLDLPKNKFIVITGLSGSGKSSLAFDTLYAEGQRRYVESLSAYARQFLQQMDKPDVDVIEGLSPAISIEQKATSHNPRSTVGTVTEIYDYLRLLFARAGTPYCPTHHIALQTRNMSQIVDTVMELPQDTKVMLLAMVVNVRKGAHVDLLSNVLAQGFTKVRINNKLYDVDDLPMLDKNKKHTIEIVIDRFKVNTDNFTRITDSISTALLHGNDKLKLVNLEDDSEVWYSTKFACPECDYVMLELEPRIFSFNAPQGACTKCDGLGMVNVFDPAKIVVHPDESVANGAIKGWDRRNSYTFQYLSALATHYAFDIEQPWCELSSKIQHILLYGDSELVEFNTMSDSGIKRSKKDKFEGILNIISRRYYETESNYVKEELSKFLSNQPCGECHGARLRIEARNVLLGKHNIVELNKWQLKQVLEYLQTVTLTGHKQEVAEKIIKEINARLGFLIDVGLDYLTLNRSAETLSGGEAQRIRLASQIGSGLTGVMYVLDEPSIGLHQRDNDRLLGTLFKLRDLGNTVIVVEHDEDAIRSADYLVDVGVGAGEHGGNILYAGDASGIVNCAESITGQYLSGVRSIKVPTKRRKQDRSYIELVGAKGNNLKNVTLKLPVGNLTCITGVSGSGKSTLINDTLYQIAAHELNRAETTSAEYTSISGLENFDKVINVDQSPIGRTPRSNPATYTGLFTLIRDLFTALPSAKERGYGPGRFSFNVKGGRCEVCQGDGMIKVEMHFLPDIYVLCEECHGKRYNRETLEIQYKGKNIAQVLAMTVEDGLEFFTNIPSIARKLQTLVDVGLSYIRLGQAATTLSGGEAQRVKLALELSKRDTGRTLYILDEPTTGLHFYDIELLLGVLHKFADKGNTVVVIEHNLDVIKTADWIVDLGPEGGVGGGQIIADGTPEAIVKNKKSITGLYLKELLEKGK